MLSFSREDIQVSLSEDLADVSFDTKETYSDRGPGYLNPYALLQGDGNIFQLTTLVPLRNNKKRVILSAATLPNRPFKPVEIAYFAALIRDCEVYLWPEPGIPLMSSRAPMLQSLADLVERRHKLNPATKEAVVESLGRDMSLAADNFIVLDHAGLAVAMNKLHDGIKTKYDFTPADNFFIKNLSPAVLDLTWSGDLRRLDEIAGAVDPATIKTIKVSTPNPEQLEKILKLFPNVDSVEFIHSPAEYLKNNLQYLPSRMKVTLDDIIWQDKPFVLPGNSRVETLTIKNTRNLKFSIAKGAQPKQLTFQDCDYLQCNLSEPGMVESLTIDHCNYCNLIINNQNNLHYLKLKDSFPFSQLDLTLLPHLKRLSLHNVRIDSLRFIEDQLTWTCFDTRRVNHSLEEIEIRPYKYAQQQINLSCYLGLKKIKIIKDQAATYEERYQFVISALPDNEVSLVEEKSIEEGRDSLFSGDEAWDIKGQKIFGWVQEYSQLHYLNTCYLPPVISGGNLETLNGCGHAAEVKISDLGKIKRAKLNLVYGDYDFDQKETGAAVINIENCPELQEAEIKASYTGTIPTKVELKVSGCPQLRKLIVDAGRQDIEIKGLDELRLNFFQLRAVNAAQFRPPSAVSSDSGSNTIDYYDETERLVESAERKSSVGRDGYGGNDGSADILLPSWVIFLWLASSSAIVALIYIMNHDIGEKITYVQTAVSDFFSMFSPMILDIFEGSLVLCALCYLAYKYFNKPSENKEEKKSLGEEKESKPEEPKKAEVVNELDNVTGECRIDGNTGGTPKYKGSIVVALYEKGKEVQSGEHRIHIYNRITIKNKKIILARAHDNLKKLKIKTAALPVDEKKFVKDLKKELKNDEYAGYLSGQIQPNRYYVLPGLHTVKNSEDLTHVYCDPVGALEFYWDTGMHQCYFKLKESLERPVKFFYRLQKNPDYELKSIAVLDSKRNVSQQRPGVLLPVPFCEEFKKLLKEDKRFNDEKYLGENPNLLHLKLFLDETKATQERMYALFQYAKGFRPDQALDPKPPEDDDIKTMIELILQYRGCCRHRSYVFNFLSHLFGFETTVNMNGQHVYCDVRYRKDDGTLNFERVHLGGAGGLKNYGESIFAVDSQQELASEEEAAFKYYYDEFKREVSHGELVSLGQIIDMKGAEEDKRLEEKKMHSTKQIFTPLILLKEGQSPLAVNAQVIKHLRENGINPLQRHIFINRPQDFAYYLTPGKLDEEGQRTVERSGPLRQLLVEGNDIGVLVINWSNFTPAQMAAYQSLLDKPPKLTVGKETFNVPANIKIMGLIKQISVGGKAFLSRSKCWDLHADFLKPDLEEITEKEPLNVDLFKASAYEELLFGEIILAGKKMKLEEGPLLQAIRMNKPLHIYNPPDTEKFKLLVHQVNEERKILHPATGKFIEIPRHVRIIAAEKPMLTALPENVTVFSGTAHEHKLEEHKRIFLSVHNIHECYKYTVVDNDRKEAKTNCSGLIGEYKPEQQVFYITGNIRKSYWQRLMAEVSKEHNRGKKFQFLLAPGASIEGLSKNLSIELELKKPTVYTSDDPDYCAAMLSAKAVEVKEESWVIDINENTTFNDLIGETFQAVDGFVAKESVVLEALRAGKHIILKGDMSLTLYYQLLPLLSGPPVHIPFNGVRYGEDKSYSLPGRLTAVLPKQTKENLPLIHHVKHDCNFQDYHKVLKDLDPMHERWLDQIELFYSRAGRLPHRGPGRPEKPYLSLKRIEMMLEILKNPAHPHNPIKNIFNHDYPKDSAEFAYFNVMGKAIFKSDDVKSMRNDKILKLKKLFKVQTGADIKANVWHFLNCFNGCDLRRILGENFEEIIDDGFPTISPRALKQLSETVFSVSESRTVLEEKVKTPRREKEMREFEFYLRNESTPIVVLQGPAGVGKTHTIRKLLGKGNFIEGKRDEDIIFWLKHGGNLLADEMNMGKSGKWDFLKGLGRKDRAVIFKGKRYVTTPKHKVIGTCNPVGPNYPGRSYQSVLQDLAVTVYFSEPSDDFYRNTIIKPLVKNLIEIVVKGKPRLAFNGRGTEGRFVFEQSRQKCESLICNHLLFACHLIKEYNPYLVRSIRDVENVTRRFLCLAEGRKLDEAALRNILLQACVGEFAPAVTDTVQRNEFINKLRAKFGFKPIESREDDECKLIPLTDTISYPEPKKYFVDAVLQDLKMRWQAMLTLAKQSAKAKKIGEEKLSSCEEKQGSVPLKDFVQEKVDAYFKQSVIVRGDPGLGKSTYLRAIVAKHKAELVERKKQLEEERNLKARTKVSVSPDIEIELALLAKEIAKPTYEVSGGSANPGGELTSAFHQEAIIVDDESNLNQKADELRGQLLSGVDENNKPTIKPGFMHLGSENSPAHGGRPDGSQSQLNRSHVINLDQMKRKELEAFAKARALQNPKQFVRAYEMICTTYSHANPRTYHEVSKRVSANEARVIAERATIGKSASTPLAPRVFRAGEHDPSARYTHASGREVVIGLVCRE